MTATVPARKPKARVMRNVQPSSPFDGLQLIRFTVAEGKAEDTYLALHWSDSCEVKVCHSDDAGRQYVVTCQVGTGKPTRCTCPAFGFRGATCRHQSAVAKLTALGHLQFPAMEDAGHDRGCTE